MRICFKPQPWHLLSCTPVAWFILVCSTCLIYKSGITTVPTLQDYCKDKVSKRHTLFPLMIMTYFQYFPQIYTFSIITFEDIIITHIALFRAVQIMFKSISRNTILANFSKTAPPPTSEKSPEHNTPESFGDSLLSAKH